MQYLTTHDLIWINEMVTGKVQPYNYVTLEACMAGQYAYGLSDETAPQAALLLERLLTKTAFLEGNRRTAFIATLAFLGANGYALQATASTEDLEATIAQTIDAVAEGRLTALQAITSIATPVDSASVTGTTLRKRIAHACNQHAQALRLLIANDGGVLMRR